MNVEIINGPSQGAMEILLRRVKTEQIRKRIKELNPNSIGLIQGQLYEVITACDIAEKTSEVFTCEISGTCPQHIAMVAVFGDTGSVEAAINAVRAKFKKTQKKT